MKYFKFLFLFIIFFTISSSDLSARKKRYHDATIQMNNGKIINGLIRLPISASDKRINYKENQDSKKQRIFADSINFITISSKKSNMVLKRTKYYSGKKHKLSKRQYWMMPRMVCDDFETFISISGFTANREGEFVEIYSEGLGYYLIQREGEDYPTTVSWVVINQPITKRMFYKRNKKMLTLYYKKDEEILKWINSHKRIPSEELVEYLEKKCKKDD